MSHRYERSDYERNRNRPTSSTKFVNEGYLLDRRRQREEIGAKGASHIWGDSPTQSDNSDLPWSDTEDGPAGLIQKARKRHLSHHHSHKKSHSKSKKSKKSKKKKHRSSRSSSRDHSESAQSTSNDYVPRAPTKEEEEFIKDLHEKRKQIEETRAESDIVGPLPQSSVELNNKDFGKALLPGEGAAMAAFVTEGKRIPRRGEIGLTSTEIESYEDVGFVMSGSRHRRMEAVRIRKENQIYSADEKRALAMFNKEERSKREAKVLNQLKDMIKSKTSNKWISLFFRYFFKHFVHKHLQ